MNYKRITELLVDALGTQDAVAKAVGVTQPTVSAWLKGKEIKGENLERLHEVAEEHGIFKHTPAPIKIRGGAGKSFLVREIDTKFGAGGGGVDTVALVSSRGNITINEEAFRSEPWEMPGAFLNSELKVAVGSAVIAEVIGDSGYDPSDPNAPGSLMPGDRVIIDSSDRRPSPSGPFAVFDGFGMVIKLVEVVHGHDPARLRLASRNPTYPPYEVTAEEAHIIGRIKGRITRM